MCLIPSSITSKAELLVLHCPSRHVDNEKQFTLKVDVYNTRHHVQSCWNDWCLPTNLNFDYLAGSKFQNGRQTWETEQKRARKLNWNWHPFTYSRRLEFNRAIKKLLVGSCVLWFVFWMLLFQVAKHSIVGIEFNHITCNIRLLQYISFSHSHNFQHHNGQSIRHGHNISYILFSEH